MIDKLLKKNFPLIFFITFLKRQLLTLSIKQSVIAASVIATGCILSIRNLGGFQLLELVVFDQMVRLQREPPPDTRILIVKITESDLKKQKKWPLSDKSLSLVLQKLQQAKAKVIGLDMYRDIPHPPGYESLLKELQKPNIITIKKLGSSDSEGVSPISGIPEERVGFNDILIDPDGIVRRNLMYAYEGTKKYYSFSLRLSQKYLATRDISLKITPNALELGETSFTPISANAGEYRNIDNLGYQILISYHSSDQVAETISFTDILNGNFDPSLVKDKIVLIGTTAPSLKDLFFTPYSAGESDSRAMSGVMLHAQLVSQILGATLDRKPLFWFWSEWVEATWILLWALIGGLIAWRYRNPLNVFIFGGFALLALFTTYFSLFTQAGWIPLLSPGLALIITSISVIIYRQLYSKFYDNLTGLPNQILFIKYLKTAIDRIIPSKNLRFAVLFLDIDRFKIVNENFGHHIGDELLVNFTQRLKNCGENQRMIARVGGDEFAILLENIADTKEVITWVDWLQKEMTFTFGTNGQEIFTTISVGIALSKTECIYKPEDVLRDAHTAMYRAKDLGKSRHEVFTKGMHIEVVKRFQLELDLRRALEFQEQKQEFYLEYQPIVSMRNNAIIGFEALVRWQHPSHGLIPTSDFIPIAEDTGLIVPLGKWILQEACCQLSVWKTLFPVDPPLTMSINLSGQQLKQPDLIEFIEKTLNFTGLEGENIKLEITESVAMKDVETTIDILLKLRSLGIRLSIDDFGTGYSSLSYLHRFPANTLKVDKSFINNMAETEEDIAIVQTIIMLGHTLGMEVVAEGVETIAQQEKLQALGCEYGQGYFFSQPLDSKSAMLLLDAQFHN